MISDLEKEEIHKILLVQVTASLDTRLGGPVQVVEKTAKMFAMLNPHNSVLVIGSNSKELKRVNHIKSILNNRYGLPLLRELRKIQKFIGHADILVLHGFYLFSTLFSVMMTSKSQIFIMPHGSLEFYQQKKSLVRKWVFDRILNFSMKGRSLNFIVGSQSKVNPILNRFPNCKVSVVGLGVELSNSTKRETRRITGKVLNLVCVSRITHKKRIDLAIRAVRLLKDKSIPCRLNIIGTGERLLLVELQGLVAELDLEDCIVFHGFLDGLEKLDKFQQADLFLLPSENENFAVAVAESITMGIPVVVSEYVAMHEFVDVYATGITMKDLTVESLVESIIQLTLDYETYSKNCIDKAHNLDWKFVFDRWKNVIYQEIEV